MNQRSRQARYLCKFMWASIFIHGYCCLCSLSHVPWRQSVMFHMWQRSLFTPSRKVNPTKQFSCVGTGNFIHSQTQKGGKPACMTNTLHKSARNSDLGALKHKTHLRPPQTNENEKGNPVLVIRDEQTSEGWHCYTYVKLTPHKNAQMCFNLAYVEGMNHRTVP